eukprot:CAMPEP_0113308688 /NCGR_PEP_ID=MMETSP0010_2-20120614/7036_1 /TAXON_ID=216773 ORGANISM="Corethron hystrix, Strain 308" /NCGR_SAMPLE_ID=MMETSP0010_2 /ASSEMBLY_ACC=CAM_ASM_000155 /LENGTH=2465 /DNA_ID=CAMNT_0000163799 /DNA_START=1 /DNA_END=7398 /DNA_ORIENTATION=- /assembly_acc=CAM_ASM_000155
MLNLWLRAQRNTSSLREMLNSFRVKKTPVFTKNPVKEHTGREFKDVGSNENFEENECLVWWGAEERSEEYSNGKNSAFGENDDLEIEYKYEAVYEGIVHSSHRKSKADNCLLDSFMERIICEHVVETSDRRKKDKRVFKTNNQNIDSISLDGEGANNSDLHTSHPRRGKRKGDQLQIETKHDVKQAKVETFLHNGEHLSKLFVPVNVICQTVLRWFAHRNQPALSIMFASEDNKYAKQPNGSEHDASNVNEVKHFQTIELISKVKDALKAKGTSDRTFARIDRRIDFNKYPTIESLFNAVETLLITYIEFSPEEKKGGLEKALIDWEVLVFGGLKTVCKNLCREFTSANYGNCGDTQVSQAVTKTECPITPLWPSLCASCQNPGRGPGSDFVTCGNCAKTYHRQCCGCEECNIGVVFIDEYEPIRQIFSVKVSPMLRDAQNAYRWLDKKVVLGRPRIDVSWGLSTKVCSAEPKLTDFLIKTGWNPNIEAEEDKVCFPLPYTGLVVLSVQSNSIAAVSGLQPGDIIVRVDKKEISNDEETKKSYWKAFILSEMSLSQRRDILNDVKDLRLYMRRPTTNIVETVQNLFEEGMARKSAIVDCGIKDVFPKKWYCLECRNKDNNQIRELSLTHKAKLCRAVIRKLGLEWCSLPFHDDCLTSDTPTRISSPCVSFRRLDLMMSYIVDKSAIENQFDQHFNPFCFPGGTERLSWLSSDMLEKPMKLLCYGMSLILSSPLGSDCYKEERKSLTKMFLELFRSWCLDREYGVIKDPPRKALEILTPWDEGVCTLCRCRVANKQIPPQTCQRCDRSSSQKALDLAFQNKKVRKSKKLLDNLSWTAFIGCPIIILPGDKVLGFVDTHGRAVEYIIVGYNEDVIDGSDSTFDIAPAYLSEHVQSTKINKDLVVSISKDKLMERVDESRQVCLALDVAVAQIAENGFDADSPKANESFEKAYRYLANIEHSFDDADQMYLYSSLVNVMCFNGVPLIRNFLDKKISWQKLPSNSASIDSDIGSSDDESLESSELTANRSNMKHAESRACYIDYDINNSEIVELPKLQKEGFASNTKYHDHTIILHRKSPDMIDCVESENKNDVIFKGKGWGVELYQAEHDKGIIHVGRICRGSPAEQAKLLTNDIVMAINGCDIASMCSPKELVRALLFTCVSQRKDPFVKSNISESIETGKTVALSFLERANKAASGPVVLNVRRYVKVLSTNSNDTRPRIKAISTQLPDRNIKSTGISSITVEPLSNNVKNNDQDHSVVHDESQENGMSYETENQAVPVNHALHHIIEPVHAAPTSGSVSGHQSSSYRRCHNGHQPPKHSMPHKQYDDGHQSSDYTWSAHQQTDHYMSHNQQVFHRSYLNGNHLYHSPPDSILTYVEAAVLAAAIKRNLPKLGVRLLCPRYDSVVLKREFSRYCMESNLEDIPIINDELWQKVVIADYNRSLDETGAIIRKEGAFGYRKPIGILPLDRILEPYVTNSSLFYSQFVQGGRPTPFQLSPNYYTEYPRQNPVHPNSVGGFSNDTGSQSLAPVPVHQANNDQCNINIKQHTECAPSNSHSMKQSTSDRITGLSNSAHGYSTNSGGSKLKSQGSSSDGMKTSSGINSHDPIVINENDDKNHVNEKRNDNSFHGKMKIGKLSTPDIQLSTIPVEKWVAGVVKGYCLTNRTAQPKETSLFLGQILSITDKSCTMCRVNVIYINNLGILPKPSTRIVKVKSLYIARKSDISILNQVKHFLKKKDVLRKQGNGKIPAEKQKYLPENNPLPPSTKNSSISSGVLPSPERKIPNCIPEYAKSRSNGQKISINDASKFLVSRLCQKESSNIMLGVLPDGGTVYWLQSDPNSLYVCPASRDCYDIKMKVLLNVLRKEKNSIRKNYKRTIKNESGNDYICCWGCTYRQDSLTSKNCHSVLSFKNREDLEDHLKCFHGIPSYSNEEVWLRVPGGSAIQELCADITSGAVSLNLRIAQVVTTFKSYVFVPPNGKEFYKSPFQKRITFNPDKLLDLTEGGKGSTNFSFLFETGVLKETNWHCRNLIRLWSRIYRIFAVEDTGNFRLKDMECSTEVKIDSISENVGICHETSKPLGKDGANKITKVCILYQKSFLERNHNIPCILCNSDGNGNGCKASKVKNPCSLSSKYFCEKLQENDAGLGEENPESAGISDSVVNSSGLVQLHSKINLVKKQLLETSSIIPKKLYKRKGAKGVHMSLSDDNNFELWRSYLKNSKSSHEVSQAFVVISRNVCESDLPNWWTDLTNGWLSVYALMNNPDLANIAMRVYAFNAAITDTCISAKLKLGRSSGSPTRRVSLTTKHNNFEMEKKNKKISNEINSTLLSVRDMRNYINISEINEELKKFEEMDMEERMKVTAGLADSFGMMRFNGISNNECSVCGDVGHVMCCEFCNVVMHWGCCTPPLDHIPEFDFVCPECILDVVTYKIYIQKYPGTMVKVPEHLSKKVYMLGQVSTTTDHPVAEI